MQIRKFLLIGAFLLINLFNSFAQNSKSSISGKITDENGEPVPGALVKVLSTSLSTTSDPNGNFNLKNIPSGKQTVQVSSIGMTTASREVSLKSGENHSLTFNLSMNVQQMETVSVIGRTTVQEANRQAYNITAIDAKELYNTTLDISGALDRVAGVRVRESGGVGSNFNFSLNGFSGNRIRFFIDGVPMDNFGSSFQINNIPINLAERVEVYKGVVPMWLGSDALGGAVNIVTGNRHRNYIDASYSFGSFNTHRSVINTAVTNNKGITLQINAFQNYSDNNYKVKVDPWNINTGSYTGSKRTLRRFHDTYHNETLITNIGVVDKKYADQLLLGITLGKNYKEIQTGPRMTTVFGQFHKRGNIVMPSLKYKKENIIKGLDITLNANYNLGKEQNIDTVNLRYNWLQETVTTGSSGESTNKGFFKYGNNNGLATAMLNYKISDRQSIALSNTFNTFNRKSRDLENPNNTDNNISRKQQKNIIGFGYLYNIHDKFSATVFLKHLHLTTAVGGSSVRNQNLNRIGYGTAATYFLHKDLQLKASYELSNRLPEPTEVFGDLESSVGNINLRPEKSNNFNIGAIYGFSLNSNSRLLMNANAIYRYATDFIYWRFSTNQTTITPDNRDGVMTYGGDIEIRYSYKNWLSAGITTTYQQILNMQKYEPEYTAISPLYKDQMPNIPYFFGNADISVNLPNIGKKGNNLSLGYRAQYIHQFWLYWPSYGTTDVKNEVPQQLSHDANIVYSLAKGKYNIGLEARNITDAILYDNFSLQKPSRGFYLNLRYFINKQ